MFITIKHTKVIRYFCIDSEIIVTDVYKNERLNSDGRTTTIVVHVVVDYFNQNRQHKNLKKQQHKFEFIAMET